MRPLVFALALCLVLPASAQAFRPFRAMFKAAKDERSYLGQARDDRLGLALKQRLALSDPANLFDVTSHVYMGQAFLVGTVENQAQAEHLIGLAKGLDGITEVHAFLVPDPDAAGKKSGSDNSTSGSDDSGFGSSMAVNQALRQDPNVGNGRLTAKVVDGTAVIMGVAKDEAERQAALQAAAGVSGIKAVKDFILLPEPGDEKRFHILD